MVRRRSSVMCQALSSLQVLLFTASLIVVLGLGVCIDASEVIDETQPANIPAEIIADWKAKDGTNYASAINKIKSEYPSIADKISGSDEASYLKAAHLRRVARMKAYTPELLKVLYAKHHDIGGSIIGFTEDLKGDGFRGVGTWGQYGSQSRSSDYGQGGNSGIYLLEFKDYYPSPTPLIEDKVGVVRDPAVSPDGTYMLYAHAKDNNGYHICEYNFATKQTRQLTDDLGNIPVSDYEPCPLPTGDIIFSSSRCFGHVDCNINLTSNMYLMNKDGKYLRRVGFDQINTFYATLMDDGSVMYTRWEYNDRNVANCFGIFTMLPDGSKQQEWFGNQTEWPATFSQARIIPGTNSMKALAIIGGHQGQYNGDLVLVDASKGRNNIGSVNCTQLIAPVRQSSGTSGINMDGVPAANKLFQNPYPIDEDYFLISFRKSTKDKFRVYFMDTEGNRELIAWDGSKSVSQPISLMKRDVPSIPQIQADYTKKTASVSVSNVYYGQQSIKGVTSGVKKIRVVAMEYRTDPAFGHTGQMGFQMTPVGRYGCTWEAKYIVGECPVESDGSAAFEVPPDVPIFLQLIADNGTCIQTMRSWMTLKPGEKFDCAGCHEDKNQGAPPVNPIAVNAKPLDKFYDLSGEPGSFYFPTVIQPLLAQNCVKSGCHDGSHSKLKMTDEKISTGTMDANNTPANRTWLKSYIELSQSKYSNCSSMNGACRPISAKSTGSIKSTVITKLLGGHVKGLSQEVIDKICAWIDLGIPHSGTYTDDMAADHKARYLERVARRDQEEAFEKKNIEEWIAAGQYCAAPYNACAGAAISPSTDQAVTRMTNEVISARFITAVGKLSVKVPSEGSIKLLDLQGRQIVRRVITREAFMDNATQQFKLNLPAGMYVVKFEGVKVSSEQVVSVL